MLIDEEAIKPNLRAFLACITGVRLNNEIRFGTIDDCLRSFGLIKKQSNPESELKIIKLTFKNGDIEYHTRKSAADRLQSIEKHIGTYIYNYRRHGHLIKGVQVEYAECYSGARQIKITNIETNEITRFESMKVAAIKMDFNYNTIKNFARLKKIYKKKYIIEYI